MWRWSDLLPFLQHPEPEARWAAANVVALLLHLADADARRVRAGALTPGEEEEAEARWLKEEAAFALEAAAALRAMPPRGRKRKAVGLEAQSPWQGPALRAPGYVELAGVTIPTAPEGAAALVAGGPSIHQLVPSASTQRALRSTAMALAVSRPVLLEGPPGSGKSLILRHLEEATGNAATAIHLHLDDQADSKGLMGAYVCTARPGEFVWRPGPLTQAVAQGRWLVFEDLDLAPAEVLAALAPLAERRELHIPARGQTLTAHPNFQLFATVTSTPRGAGVGTYGSAARVLDMLGSLFNHVKGGEAIIVITRRASELDLAWVICENIT